LLKTILINTWQDETAAAQEQEEEIRDRRYGERSSSDHFICKPIRKHDMTRKLNGCYWLHGGKKKLNKKIIINSGDVPLSE
jgi:hypothetical protein